MVSAITDSSWFRASGAARREYSAADEMEKRSLRFTIPITRGAAERRFADGPS